MAHSVSPKVVRLLSEGRVMPAGSAAAFTVAGDHGEYVAVIFDDGRGLCSCPAHGECSHLSASRLVNDAMVDGVAATVARMAA